MVEKANKTIGFSMFLQQIWLNYLKIQSRFSRRFFWGVLEVFELRIDDFCYLLLENVKQSMGLRCPKYNEIREISIFFITIASDIFKEPKYHIPPGRFDV